VVFFFFWKWGQDREQTFAMKSVCFFLLSILNTFNRSSMRIYFVTNNFFLISFRHLHQDHCSDNTFQPSAEQFSSPSIGTKLLPRSLLTKPRKNVLIRRTSKFSGFAFKTTTHSSSRTESRNLTEQVPSLSIPANFNPALDARRSDREIRPSR
jgi:hypothetical protein